MKKAFKHDYSGSCTTEKTINNASQSKFSVGLFQWIPKVSGKGLKKTAVIFRITGPTANPEAVYCEAKRICDEMDKGIFPKGKSKRLA